MSHIRQYYIIYSITSHKELQELLKISVSFKNTTKETKLYITIKNMEEQSEFIKRACEFYLKYLEKEIPPKEQVPKPSGTSENIPSCFL